MDIFVGKLYKLNAPWHRSHDRDVLVMYDEENKYYILEEPFSFHPIEDWDTVFYETNFSVSNNWYILEHLLTNKKSRDFIITYTIKNPAVVGLHINGERDGEIFLTRNIEYNVSNTILKEKIISILKLYYIDDESISFKNFIPPWK